MGWDDEDDWPEPERDPEALAKRREAISGMVAWRRKALRWVYAGLGLLLVVVILVATLR